ncbi:hypothetical protein KY290_021150 [Solanum tuberosum]|uniref:Uncharacterized protein n=1 Tax=Solanum tuberosum TaxID=4113 RepID=A0ABQ7V2R2_SOLTU|nr:hypothetical protein KY289_020330 [Solanum tuberosum]KAH0692985.1 hypothetical protein KY285_020082 [Solanum tuberosum]KAH0757657.1 hypothetical protein KY290_021150 [Solanum tuberosum]
MVASSSRILPEHLASTTLFTNRSESVTQKQQKKSYNPMLCHLKSNCYKLNGYPPHYKGRRDHVVAAAHNTFATTEHNISPNVFLHGIFFPTPSILSTHSFFFFTYAYSNSRTTSTVAQDAGPRYTC